MISFAFPFYKTLKKNLITLLTSSTGFVTDPRATVMSIGSAMVKQLIECSALEGAYHGIRVNGVAAGVTNTRARMATESMTQKLDAGLNKANL